MTSRVILDRKAHLMQPQLRKLTPKQANPLPRGRAAPIPPALHRPGRKGGKK